MRFLVLIGFLLFTVQSQAQNKIKWMTWEEAIAAQKVDERKILVDVYTDWCKVCKKMDKYTFQKDRLAKYINENYYPVKFNAESRQDITFRNKVYKYVNKVGGGYHELALVITQGKLKFPTYVFLDETMSILQPIPGYQDSKTFGLIASYFANDFYKNTPWRSYVNQNATTDVLSVPVKN